ncbi:zinc finger and BTB domain-containing protein 25 isoform X1 [Ascaphus truei]|uniref:zinc finger and BTB domain-containing protein 25 isoform X1 n=2 Tax=Ascaphus truei TaxID=8439 RepID=UPI003F5A4AF7
MGPARKELRSETMDPSSHSLVLLQQLNMQREFGFLCDCTVAIGDVYFKAHRSVLAAFSNYFRMIFIHQSSDCIKIQPADIQPDIFSYILHVMYTGKSPKQAVDLIRLEEGIHFLHANLLSHSANETSQVLLPEPTKASNLYGIQISTAQKTHKKTMKLRDNPSTATRSVTQGEHPQLQLSLAIGLEGGGQDQQISHFPAQVGAAGQSIEEIQQMAMSIKQETCDHESPHPLPPLEDSESTFLKVGNKMYSCHYCGARLESRVNLRDHLHIHASQSLPFGVPASILESDDLGEIRPILENIENMESLQLDNYLLNKNEEPAQHTSHSHQAQLLLNQISFLSKDADPGVEVNCNFSFLKKRKLSCTLCGHKFLRRSQLLEHLYTHKSKPHKPGRYQRFGNQVDQTLQTYCNNLTDGTQKSSDASPDHMESPGEVDTSVPQENVESVTGE